MPLVDAEKLDGFPETSHGFKSKVSVPWELQLALVTSVLLMQSLLGPPVYMRACMERLVVYPLLSKQD